MAMAVALCLINAVLLAVLWNWIPILFTTDGQVSRLITAAIPVILILQAFDTLAAFCHGLLRGIGRQEVCGYANLAAYYVFALPISFGAGFGLEWELSGLWTGMTVGLFL